MKIVLRTGDQSNDKSCTSKERVKISVLSLPFPVVYYPVVLKRLDARYDWLPSPSSTMGNKTLPMYYCHDGCETVTGVNGSVALVTYNGNCSVFEKVRARAVAQFVEH